MKGIITLGAGLSGLSFSYFSGHQTIVYEQKNHHGGRCYTHEKEGFFFDEGPHISFTGNPLVQSIFAAGAGEFQEFKAEVRNYYLGKWLKHPVQTNLYGLPYKLTAKCIKDFILRKTCRNPKNYGQWLEASLGSTMARTFPYAYTRKYWTVIPEELTTDWVGRRMHRPSLAEVLIGALGSGKATHNYIQTFRYPRSGGFHSYVNLLTKGADIRLGYCVTGLDLKKRRVDFSDGSSVYYDRLVSTIPLPRLVASLYEAPEEIREAARCLHHTSAVLVNLGFKEPLDAKGHWIYVYDPDKLPARIHFPHLMAPANTPPGCSSLQAEIYYSPFKPLPALDLMQTVIKQLKWMGIIRDEPVLAFTKDISYANILYTHNRYDARKLILGYLGQYGVHCLGRYGSWEYLWSDQAVMAGLNLARQLGFKQDE